MDNVLVCNWCGAKMRINPASVKVVNELKCVKCRKMVKIPVEMKNAAKAGTLVAPVKEDKKVPEKKASVPKKAVVAKVIARSPAKPKAQGRQLEADGGEQATPTRSLRPRIISSTPPEQEAVPKASPAAVKLTAAKKPEASTTKAIKPKRIIEEAPRIEPVVTPVSAGPKRIETASAKPVAKEPALKPVIPGAKKPADKPAAPVAHKPVLKEVGRSSTSAAPGKGLKTSSDSGSKSQSSKEKRNIKVPTRHGGKVKVVRGGQSSHKKIVTAASQKAKKAQRPKRMRPPTGQAAATIAVPPPPPVAAPLPPSILPALAPAAATSAATDVAAAAAPRVGGLMVSVDISGLEERIIALEEAVRRIDARVEFLIRAENRAAREWIDALDRT